MYIRLFHDSMFMSQEYSASLRILQVETTQMKQEQAETTSRQSMLEREVKQLKAEKKQMANKLIETKENLKNMKV